MSASCLILGCGYTGRRVAPLLEAGRVAVAATNRSGQRLPEGVRALRYEASLDDPRDLPAADILIYSLPTLRTEQGLDEPAPRILEAMHGRYRRVLYLSTTGVYGQSQRVDENTPISPGTERQRLRVAAEEAVSTGPWESLILRPAAIYGPGRGVQVALPQGKYKLAGDGSNYVSRIHVDDLAAITAVAALSPVTGAYPVADDYPSTSREIAEYCAELLGLPPPASTDVEDLSETRRSNRRVDGRAIRKLLGVGLRYPSFREGIPASLGNVKSS